MKDDDTFSIFILKSQASSLAQAETFLKNRKWTVVSTTNLKEALAYIIQKQPQYVLITADHPNKKVKVLPKMLMQAFPIKIIGFSEKSSSDSSRSLTGMALDYNLYPPVSGPAIERIVLKIRKDEENKGKEPDGAKASVSGKVQSGDQSITLRGGGVGHAEEEQKRSFEQARAALAQMMNDGGEAELAAKADVHIQKGTAQNLYNETQGSVESSQNFQEWEEAQRRKRESQAGEQGANNRGAAYMPDHEESSHDPASPYHPSHQAHDANGNPIAGQQAPGARGGIGYPGSHSANTGSDLGQASQSGPNASTTGLTPEEMDLSPEAIAKLRAARKAAGLPEDGSGEEDVYKRKEKRTPIMEAEYQRRKEKEIRYFSDAAKSTDKDSIIVKGTTDALNNSVTVTGSEAAEEIEEASNVACITIESPRFSGYLICALAKDQKVDKSLIDMINKRLMSFLKDNGESVKDQDAMEIKIQAVDFIDWSIEQAQFLKKSVHNGQEIAMAFFPHKDMKTVFEASGPNNMIQLSLDELKADAPVEFDLYIYMPENDKYILYTPEGGNLYGRQKNRLKEKGVSHMHVKESAVAGLKKYQAQNYLNDQIDVYKKNKEDKKSDVA